MHSENKLVIWQTEASKNYFQYLNSGMHNQNQTVNNTMTEPEYKKSLYYLNLSINDHQLTHRQIIKNNLCILYIVIILLSNRTAVINIDTYLS